MVDIITAEELASYLGTAVTPAISLLAGKTNELITEAWSNPTDSVPTSVWALAINVATRAASNPKGLTSWTRSWDDITRTERVETGDERRFGLYLTDDELADLNGTTTGRIGTLQTPTRGMRCQARRC